MNQTDTDKAVLLVDDEVDICDFLSEYLQDRNLKSYSATNIEKALEIAQEKSIDLIFLDNNLLSNVKGVEFIPEFKKINPTCKVYMLSANSKPEVRQRAQLLGADGFIAKPFDFVAFDSVLEKLINTK
ncbi:response regulator [Candidatus Omnitrophota bacterium]